MNQQVAILMSTYNGERYLADQIKSIQNQSYPNWHLYIRDDGSKDNTINIIQKYADADKRITLTNYNAITNVGVTSSFMKLLQSANADFYMFCDQDDVWLKDKIELAVNQMQVNNYLATPLCVFTELQVVNQNLHPMHLMNGNQVWFDLPHFLVGNCVTGCTMMINQALKNSLKISDTNFHQIYLHDWWIGMVASVVGKLIYIPKPTILYRQHANNVEGSKPTNMLTLIKRSLNLGKERKAMNKMLAMDAELNRLFGDRTTGHNRQYLREYASLTSQPTFGKRLKLVIKCPPQRSHAKGKLLFSYLILTNHR